MATQARGYTVPVSILEVIDRMPKSRSQLFTEAIRDGYKDPNRLISTLRRRLDARRFAPTPTNRVTVSVLPSTVEQLSDLTETLQIGTEHILRLCLEDYIHRHGR